MIFSYGINVKYNLSEIGKQGLHPMIEMFFLNMNTIDSLAFQSWNSFFITSMFSPIYLRLEGNVPSYPLNFYNNYLQWLEKNKNETTHFKKFLITVFVWAFVQA